MKITSVVLTVLLGASVANAFTTSSGPSFVAAHRDGASGDTRLRMVQEAVELVQLDTEERMGKSLESVMRNLDTVRTGRANASLLDRVVVEYYGAPTPLNQLASVSVSSSQQLTVDPYDKSCTPDVEKAIMESDLGLTPNNDGTVLRINIPALTEDRRKELLKLCSSIGEDGKVAVRNVRRDSVDKIKKMEKKSEIGKDESLDALDEIQKITDDNMKKIETIVKKKEKDVMTV